LSLLLILTVACDHGRNLSDRFAYHPTVARSIWRLLAAALTLAVVVVGTVPGALAQPSPQPVGVPPAEGDYPIPNGHFFTQAAPGQGGNGYRVANEAGIPFWDAFQETGGVATLGYPLTRRFVWNGTVVQAFQNGALRWLPTESRTERRPLADLGELPGTAKRTEPPLVYTGEAARKPWSGWWWPANDVVYGPRLFDSDGPLARYDNFVASLGRPDPETMEWERAEIRFSGLAWAGHCNGWAAASLLEPEPTAERTVNGTTFSVADQKGLLSSYHFADAAAWAVGSEEVDVMPAQFHRAATRWIAGERKGAIFTFRPAGEEVWSYPAWKIATEIGPDPLTADLWHVTMTVWLVDNDVPAGFVGSKPWPSPAGKVLRYTLTGPDPHNPTGGEWHPSTPGGFGRPFMVWYPDPNSRNIGRQLASPNLDYALVRQITRGPERPPLFDPRIPRDTTPPSAPPAPTAPPSPMPASSPPPAGAPSVEPSPTAAPAETTPAPPPSVEFVEVGVSVP